MNSRELGKVFKKMNGYTNRAEIFNGQNVYDFTQYEIFPYLKEIVEGVDHTYYEERALRLYLMMRLSPIRILWERKIDKALIGYILNFGQEFHENRTFEIMKERFQMIDSLVTKKIKIESCDSSVRNVVEWYVLGDFDRTKYFITLMFYLKLCLSGQYTSLSGQTKSFEELETKLIEAYKSSICIKTLKMIYSIK